MNKNIQITVGVVVFAVIVGGIYISNNVKKDAMLAKEQMEQKAMEENKLTEEKTLKEKETVTKDSATNTDGMMKKDDTSMTAKSDTMVKAGSYEAYAPEKVLLASATHDVVLFFRASWCPTCRAIDADIKANLSKIPEGLAILDVNYDNSTALKQKYGVTYQHTFVQVDKDGNLIKKWSGSPTLSALVSEVK
jgi:thiol-disulfide isomerase/thioredoxin